MAEENNSKNKEIKTTTRTVETNVMKNDIPVVEKSVEVVKTTSIEEKKDDKNIAKSDSVKTETSTVTQNTPKKKNGGCFWKVFFFIILCLILIGVGVGAGAYGYPIAHEWLVNHGFIKTDSKGDTKLDLSNTSNNLPPMTEDEAIINVVKNSRDSVVSIAISKVQLGQNGVTNDKSNVGSGFIVDPSGIIVTNQHVVSDTSVSYKVVTTDGREFDVKQVVTDDYNDIAILKVDAKDLKSLPLGDSDKLQLGQGVVAIGTPLGEFAGSVTTGVISGLNRSVTAGQSGFWGISKVYENVIQTDAAINPGNSGGPLLNLKGEVVGIDFATTSGASNISFALPINVLKLRLDEFRTYGKIIKPYLGVQYQMVSEAEARLYKNVVAGALVARVSADSPAALAGIQNADIITEFGGEKVNVSLSMLIQKHKVGDEVDVKLHRGDQELTVKVKLVEAK
jgi:serine protease Do